MYDGPRGADVVVYSPDTDALLLLVRGKNPFRGFLVPPSGGVKPGESFAQAAIRELHEETGLVTSVDSLEVVRDYRYEDFDPRGRLWSRRFLLRVTGQPEVVAGDDATSHRWVCVDDVPFWHLAIEQAVGIRDALILAGRIPAEPTL
jgi:8-oxo-dGTP diphosphatase